MKKTSKKILILFFIFTICAIAVLNMSCKNNGVNPPPNPPSPPTKIDVLTFRSSAKDDLEMIQKAVNYAAANKIGVVFIPDGEYWIDASVSRGITLLDNIHLELSAGAALKALPTGSGNYNIIKIQNTGNVKVTGGKIIGERYEHTGTAGEWGMGIDIRNATNVELRDIHVSDCWGDGVYIAGKSKDIMLYNVVCDNNRRQGMSVIAVDRLTVKKSHFKNTNGASPQAGVDLEPNNTSDVVKDVLIDSCTFTGNAGLGLHMYGKYGSATNIKVINSEMSNNPIGVSMRYENINQIELHNLKISGSSTESFRVFDGSKDVKATQIVIDDSKKQAVRIADAQNVELTEFFVNEYTTNGLLIGNSGNVKVSSSIFQTNTSTALGAYISSSAHVELSSVELKGGLTGISSSQTKKLKLINSTLKMLSDVGLYINSSDSAYIHNNSFNEIAKTPLRINNSKKNIITNNLFSNNCFLTDNTYSQINFEGISEGNELKENNITESTKVNRARYGISLQPTTKLNIITNNVIASGAYRTAAIKDDGVNNQVVL